MKRENRLRDFGQVIVIIVLLRLFSLVVAVRAQLNATNITTRRHSGDDAAMISAPIETMMMLMMRAEYSLLLLKEEEVAMLVS